MKQFFLASLLGTSKPALTSRHRAWVCR